MPVPSGTQLLIEVMEEFGDCEPKHIVVVWTDQDGNLHTDANCGHTQLVGLMEYAKYESLRHLAGEPKSNA